VSAVRDPIYEDPSWTPAAPDDPFGPLVTAFDVEQALAWTIRRWMPDYLLKVERDHGLPAGRLPTFRSEVATAWRVGRLPEDQLPALMIVSPGLHERPKVFGDGTFTARWRVDITSICSARGNRVAPRLARWYAAGVRLLLQQNQGLESQLTVTRIDWNDERYDVLDVRDERTLAGGLVQVLVDVADVARREFGPAPAFPPGAVGELSEVLSHEIVIQKEDT
jgi:hypothetical protein